MADKNYTSERIDKADEDLYSIYKGVSGLIRRRWKSIMLIFLFGVLGGVFYYFSQTPYYLSKMAARYTLLESGTFDNKISLQTTLSLVNNLNVLIDNKEYKVLAEKLGIAEEDAKNIKEFDAEKVKLVYGFEKDDIVIFIYTYNTSNISKLDQALVYYLENNELIKSNFAEYIAILNANVAALERRINVLDSLKGQLTFKKTEEEREKAIEKMIELETTSLNAQNNIFWIQRKLALLGKVELVMPIETNNQPYHPSVLKVSVYTLVFIIFLGVIIILFQEGYSRIQRVKNATK